MGLGSMALTGNSRSSIDGMMMAGMSIVILYLHQYIRKVYEYDEYEEVTSYRILSSVRRPCELEN